MANVNSIHTKKSRGKGQEWSMQKKYARTVPSLGRREKCGRVLGIDVYACACASSTQAFSAMEMVLFSESM